MKAALGAEHACRWLVEATRHSLTELQEPLLRYVKHEWRTICDKNPETAEQLREYPNLMLAIMVGMAERLPRPAKRRRV